MLPSYFLVILLYLLHHGIYPELLFADGEHGSATARKPSLKRNSISVLQTTDLSPDVASHLHAEVVSTVYATPAAADTRAVKRSRRDGLSTIVDSPCLLPLGVLPVNSVVGTAAMDTVSATPLVVAQRAISMSGLSTIPRSGLSLSPGDTPLCSHNAVSSVLPNPKRIRRSSTSSSLATAVFHPDSSSLPTLHYPRIQLLFSMFGERAALESMEVLEQLIRLLKLIITELARVERKSPSTTAPLTVAIIPSDSVSIVAVADSEICIQSPTVSQAMSSIPVTTISQTTSSLPIVSVSQATSSLPVTTISQTTSSLPVTTISQTTSSLPVTTISQATSSLPITTLDAVNNLERSRAVSSACIPVIPRIFLIEMVRQLNVPACSERLFAVAQSLMVMLAINSQNR